MTTLTFLTNITIVLFIGLLMGLIARKLKVPSMLLLIIAGAVLKNLQLQGTPVVEFSSEFLITTSILALVMIVFEGSSNFSLHDIDTYSESAFKIVIMFLAFNMLFLSVTTYFIFAVSA